MFLNKHFSQNSKVKRSVTKYTKHNLIYNIDKSGGQITL